MFVAYRQASLEIDQLIYTASPEFMAAIVANPALGVIETSLDKGANELAIKLVGGQPALVERLPLAFTVPATASVGVEVRITGVPTGTQITSETGSVTMVSSGILDLTFDVAGLYSLTFTHPLYLTLTASIEVAE